MSFFSSSTRCDPNCHGVRGTVDVGDMKRDDTHVRERAAAIYDPVPHHKSYVTKLVLASEETWTPQVIEWRLKLLQIKHWRRFP
jgi:hypothetical protein